MASTRRSHHGSPATPARTIDRPAVAQPDPVAAEAVPNRVLLDHGVTVGRQTMPGQMDIDHPNVSGRHAVFEVVNGTVVLRDLSGNNGTYVNGARLRGARALIAGDRIDIGPFELTFDGAAVTRAWRVSNVELLVRGVATMFAVDRVAAFRNVSCTPPTCVFVRPSLLPSSVPTAPASPR